MDLSMQNFSQAEKQAREQILSLVSKALGKGFSANLVEIEMPPDSKLGDYSLPCFLLSKKLKKSPAETAKNLASQIKPSGIISQVQAAGPYLNFFVNKIEFNKLVLTEIAKAKDKYGQSKLGKGKKVMVEYFSPNTNKPLTVGHLRNICLGYSLVEIMKFLGYKVLTSTIYNDRGIALAKTILTYQKWGKNKTPKDAKLKSDHFVGDFYVRFGQEAKADPELEKAAQKVLQDWEAGDPKIKKIWQKLILWALKGYEQTLKVLGIPSFDEKYYESEHYQAAKEIVQEGLKNGVFKKHPDGYIFVELEEFGLPDKILLRSDGTSLYLTQDLYLAKLKNKHSLDQSIVVSAEEQNIHFKQLFKILELLGFKNTKSNYHFSYGMMRLSSGRIKSREGLVQGTGADELIGYLQSLAINEIKNREPKISQKELDQRSLAIALGALKFYILAVDAKTTMIFEPKKSLAFTGKTGPYLQYVYARINSIFQKVKEKPSLKVDFSKISQPAELALVKLLAQFPNVVFQAADKHNPGEVANYLYELAKAFSVFYEQVPVAQAEAKTRKARLLLIKAVRMVLATGLSLLGITTPEKM